MKRRGHHQGPLASSRTERVASTFVASGGPLRTCLGCSRIMTQVEAAQHSPSLCCHGDHGIELKGRVLQGPAQA